MKQVKIDFHSKDIVELNENIQAQLEIIRDRNAELVAITTTNDGEDGFNTNITYLIKQ